MIIYLESPLFFMAKMFPKWLLPYDLHRTTILWRACKKSDYRKAAEHARFNWVSFSRGCHGACSTRGTLRETFFLFLSFSRGFLLMTLFQPIRAAAAAFKSKLSSSLYRKKSSAEQQPRRKWWCSLHFTVHNTPNKSIEIFTFDYKMMLESKNCIWIEVS